MVLRKLFKKFENQWSRFQKHSKLQQNYTIGRLKSIKQKIDCAEALWHDKELQKKIHKKYKVFCAKYEDKQGVFESRDEEIKKFALNFKELDKNAFKLYMSHRYPVDESSPIYKQNKLLSEDIEEANTSPVNEQNQIKSVFTKQHFGIQGAENPPSHLEHQHNNLRVLSARPTKTGDTMDSYQVRHVRIDFDKNKITTVISSQKTSLIQSNKAQRPLLADLTAGQQPTRDGLSSTEDMTAMNSQHFEAQTANIMMSYKNDESSIVSQGMHFMHTNENQSVRDVPDGQLSQYQVS